MGNKIFGERVKMLRENNGLSLDQLAKALGVNKSRVGMWESNGTVPREEALIGLSKFFKVSTDYLLGNDNLDGAKPDNSKLHYLQRNLGKLNREELEKAEGVLKVVFKDIFDDDEDDDEI